MEAEAAICCGLLCCESSASHVLGAVFEYGRRRSHEWAIDSVHELRAQEWNVALRLCHNHLIEFSERGVGAVVFKAADFTVALCQFACIRKVTGQYEGSCNCRKKIAHGYSCL